MTARPIATLFPGHVCMDNLATERSLDLQATLVFDVIGLFFDMLSTGVVQPVNDRRPVDWRRN